MSETILVALIVSVVAPGALVFLNGRQANQAKREDLAIRLAEKNEDYKRQDLVAARAEEAAKAIVEANQHTAEVVTANSQEILSVATKTHELVNSAMTVQKELTLTFAKTTLAALQQNAMDSPSTSKEQKAQIVAMQSKVKELENELVERARQQKTMDAKDAASAAANAKPTVVEFASPQEVSVVGVVESHRAPDQPERSE